MATMESTTVTRRLVLIGEDDDADRRGSKVAVAESRCEFICHDDATLERCVESIRKSDEHLRNRPEEMMLWDWKSTWVEQGPEFKHGGGKVILGVAWYDEQFFIDKADAYLNPLHLGMYTSIGIEEGAITVSHWKLAGGGSL